ncbi:MAG: SurA N-terminal domain-containing protein [Armatimonadota bacterium]
MSITRMRKQMQGWFRYVVYLLALIFVGGIIALAVGGSMMQNADSGNTGDIGSPKKIIAIVNGEKITSETFENAITNESAMYEQMGQQPGTFEQVQLRQSVLDRLVQQRLMVQAAGDERISVSKRDINKKIDEYIKMEIDKYRNQLLDKTKGPKTDEALNIELDKRQKGLTVKKISDDIRKSINRDAVKDQLMIEGLQKKLETRVDSSDKALTASYDEVKIAQITIDDKKRSTAEAESKAKELVKKIRAGEDFAKTAITSSDDYLAKKGGERDYAMGRTYIEPELAGPAFSLKQGEISDPIKMPQGYMIIKILEKKNNLPKDFNDPKKHKTYLDQYVQNEKGRLANTFFEDVKKKAKIEMVDPEMKAHDAMKQIMTAQDEAGRKTAAINAIEAYKKALSDVNGETSASARIYSQMVMIYNMLASSAPGDNETAKAEKTKYRTEAKDMLIEALNYAETNQLRLMLVNMNIDDKEYDKALENLLIVSDNAYNENMQVHAQIQAMAARIPASAKSAEILAKEKKWMDDYNQKMKEQQTTSMPVPSQP